MTGVLLYCRHIGMRHATDPDVLKRRLHLGLESCGHGCGALIIRRFLPRHQLTCRGEEARAGVGYTTEGGGRGTRGEGGATLTITSYKHRLVADSEHTNTFVDFEKFKRNHRLLP